MDRFLNIAYRVSVFFLAFLVLQEAIFHNPTPTPIPKVKLSSPHWIQKKSNLVFRLFERAWLFPVTWHMDVNRRKQTQTVQWRDALSSAEVPWIFQGGLESNEYIGGLGKRMESARRSHDPPRVLFSLSFSLPFPLFWSLWGGERKGHLWW